MINTLDRERWSVPVRGQSPTGPAATVQTRAHPDGSVVLHLTCGEHQVEVRLDACRATQLCTGLWEAATVSQRPTVNGSDHQPPRVPAPGTGARRTAQRSSARRDRFATPWQKPPSARAPAPTAFTRAIGMRIQRIRIAQNKSLRVIAQLAGTSAPTLRRIEHGRREVTLAEIIALAEALQTTPAALTPTKPTDC